MIGAWEWDGKGRKDATLAERVEKKEDPGCRSS
jgi:hypothetical protein